MQGCTIEPNRVFSATGGVSKRAYKSGPQFGSATELRMLKEAATMGEKEVAKIAHSGIADKLLGFFSKGFFQKDVRVGGMSLEDVAARLQTLIGVYIMQGYLSIKDQKHPWETNGRNAVVWLLTTYVVQFLKNDKMGVNTLLLNPFMRQKVADTKGMNPLQKLVNKFRMDADYVDILKRAGVKVSGEEHKLAQAGKKSVWASQDVNLLTRVNTLFDELKLKVKTEGIEALSAEDQQVFKAMPKFLRRINAFPLVSTALITAATVYIVGSLAMKFVYKFIAPFDKDFDPNKGKKGAAAPAAPGAPATAAAAPKALSFAQPGLFQQFQQGGR